MTNVARTTDAVIRSLRDKANAIQTVTQQTEWLKTAQAELAALEQQRDAAIASGQSALGQLYQQQITRLSMLINHVRTLDRTELAAHEARLARLAEWQAAEEAAANQIIQLREQVARSMNDLAAAKQQFAFDTATPKQQHQMLEQQIQDLIAGVLGGASPDEIAALRQTAPDFLDAARRAHKAPTTVADAVARFETEAAKQRARADDVTLSNQEREAALRRALELEAAAKRLLDLEEQRRRVAEQIEREQTRETEQKQRLADETERIKAETLSVQATTPEQQRAAIEARRRAELAPLQRELETVTDAARKQYLQAQIALINARADQQLRQLTEKTHTPTISPQIATDQLTRIGLHVGARGVATDYTRLSARYLDQLVRRVERGIKVQITNPQPTIATAA